MNSLLKNTYRIGALGILFIAVSLLSDTWLYPYFYHTYTKGQAEKVQEQLLQKQKAADAFLHEAAAIPLPHLQGALHGLYEEGNKNHINLYITRADGSVIYYSTNSVFPARLLNSVADSQLQRLPNGFYLQNNILANGLVYISLVPVQYHYSIENQFLKNDIPFLRNDEDFVLTKNAADGYPIYNQQHSYLFSLSPKNRVEIFGWIAFLYLAGALLLLLALGQWIRWMAQKGKNEWAATVYILANALFLYSWKILRLPDNLYRWPVFSSHFYGSSAFFSSLGDLLCFVLIVFFFFVFITSLRVRFSPKGPLKWLVLVLLVSTSYVFSAQIVNLVSSLILDSIISFDLSNIFNLDFYSVVGIVVMFIFIGSYFIFIGHFSRFISRNVPHPLHLGLVIAVSVTAASFILLAFSSSSYYISFAFNTICILLYYFRDRFFSWSRFFFTLTVLSISSLFISIVLSKYNEINQNDDQQATATNIITERDPVAEYLFTGIYDEISTDGYIRDYFTMPPISEQVLQNRIQQVYFSSYFGKYDIEVNTFTPDGQSFKNVLGKPLAYYKALIGKEGAPTNVDNRLYFMHLHTGLPTYVSNIPIISPAGDVMGIVMLEIQQKPFYEESIYPELLVSENLRKFSELQKYSYAVYGDRMLLNQKGEYAYPGVQNFTLRLDSNNFASFKEGGFEHFVYQPHPDLIVIVSSPSPGILYYLSSFAFVFFFMCIGYALVNALRYGYRIAHIAINRKNYALKQYFSFKNLSFRNKILITVLSGMTVSMILIGIVTVSYIMVHYNKDEVDNLRKKTRLITNKLSNDLQQNERQASLHEPDLRDMVRTLSDMYQADINIFDVKGNLVNSTENAIFDKGIISPEMDAETNLKFSVEKTSQVIKEEKIGQLKFLSCYMPVRNISGQVIGYLNLPYFSKEQELKDRISSFVVALVNLYLLLFLLLAVLGIFMTRVLTLPLNIIRNHLRNTSLSGTNEFITWNTRDEIGKLVNEYNTMIVALKESVDRLAQSERENTLKELAQHVAHEIKNPLTPMKLGIQQLQNAYANNDPDYDTLFKKVTSLIIRQIDTLSAIATDFNDSARLGNPQAVNINTVLQQICDLFSHNLSVSMRLDLDAANDVQVFADVNKLTRVFTNLINNAVQSVPETRRGIITIRNHVEDGNVIISIEDNGSGIPESLRKKIFVPNFSTKSSGTGLGLAIVKAIVEQAGGSIAFSSVVDKGSVFTVTLPIIL